MIWRLELALVTFPGSHTCLTVGMISVFPVHLGAADRDWVRSTCRMPSGWVRKCK